MAYKVKDKQRTVIDEIEQYRLDTIRSLILQGLRNKASQPREEKVLERACEILKEKNDSFMYNITIEKTDLTFSEFGKQDHILYPCTFKGKEYSDIKLGELKIGSDLFIFNPEDEEDDPFLTRSKPMWTIKNVVHVEVIEKDESIIVYSEDCKRYKISFDLTEIMQVFKDEEVSVE